MANRRSAYDTLGRDFEAVMNRYDLERRLGLLLERVPAQASRTLEVGCGLGYLSEQLRLRKGLRPVSFDIAKSLLSIGRARERIDRPVCGDALALPFAERTFDLVVSTECIEHTSDPRGAVRELVRVAKPGALLVLTCPNATWHWAVRLANRLRLRPYEGYENWPGFAELRGWIETEGLIVLEHLGFHVLPFQLPLARHWLPFADRLVLRARPAMAINQLLVARRPS